MPHGYAPAGSASRLRGTILGHATHGRDGEPFHRGAVAERSLPVFWFARTRASDRLAAGADPSAIFFKDCKWAVP